MSGERCAAGKPSLAEGQSVAVLGSNGAGKTTLMRALAGLQPPAARGEIRFEGRSISRDAAHRRVRAGLVLVPEGRQVFPELSVRDNLRLGAFANSGANLDARIERMLHRFPRLRERLGQRAGLLSGGESSLGGIPREAMQLHLEEVSRMVRAAKGSRTAPLLSRTAHRPRVFSIRTP